LSEVSESECEYMSAVCAHLVRMMMVLKIMMMG
jgi:hypothetical protein